jgi:DNA-directed RNA polymerase specialized sigma24 family protein
MSFTARDLRYHPDESYPLLYAYLHRCAQRYLGAFKYDAFEVDTVIGHVVEQLVRLGLLGGGNQTTTTVLDTLNDAQFYAFLNRSTKNKAIDRLRKRRLQINNVAELESVDDEDEIHPLDNATESIWGNEPFATPEEITLHQASQQELRGILKHCISLLSAAPNQLQAVLLELQECGAEDLVEDITEELDISFTGAAGPHVSQHKDHAHKKLRHCLQQKSSNLTVQVALRLTEYKQPVPGTGGFEAEVADLTRADLSEQEIRTGLQSLVSEGLLDWHGEETVTLSAAQARRLTRFYKET